MRRAVAATLGVVVLALVPGSLVILVATVLVRVCLGSAIDCKKKV